ncbi:hypothetical protein [Stenotrophomonas cyclobalanopsidis]|uniref:hypothetical protein n=1 Tax=Stenotrophomonas cyclobalanopsidis TaxID=2771362 RepID=UPI001FE44458|nr:hypothetical protein [Stenotrophomonas cyclobalanopsidis]
MLVFAVLLADTAAAATAQDHRCLTGFSCERARDGRRTEFSEYLEAVRKTAAIGRVSNS